MADSEDVRGGAREPGSRLATVLLSASLVLTNGSPQYVHQQICGLSTLMKMRGWPRGPPPPSQETMRSFVHRTGCLWMRSIAASGRG